MVETNWAQVCRLWSLVAKLDAWGRRRAIEQLLAGYDPRTRDDTVRTLLNSGLAVVDQYSPNGAPYALALTHGGKDAIDNWTFPGYQPPQPPGADSVDDRDELDI